MSKVNPESKMEENGEMSAMSTNIIKILDQMQNLESRLSSVEAKLDDQLDKLAKKVEGLVDSQKFINKCFESHKLQAETLIKKDTARENALNELIAKVNRLEKDLNQEKSERNIVDQYHRSSINVKIMGAKLSAEEVKNADTDSSAATLELVNLLVSLAKIANFDTTQIDVRHRLKAPKNTNFPPPIIIRFKHKCDKINSFR